VNISMTGNNTKKRQGSTVYRGRDGFTPSSSSIAHQYNTGDSTPLIQTRCSSTFVALALSRFVYFNGTNPNCTLSQMLF